MVAFAFLGNTLFLTILVSMLSTNFSNIVQNSTAEIQFRRAVLTLEGVKGDAIFAYQPPFNVLAFFVLVPLKWCASPRWFHKIHVFSVRLLNLPLLLIIAFLERRALSRGLSHTNPTDYFKPDAPRKASKSTWFWDRWRITSHSDIETVFEVPPPDSVLEEITGDDDLTRNMIRRQFTRHNTIEGSQQPPPELLTAPQPNSSSQSKPSPQPKQLSRRDSIAPFPGLRAELHDVLSESNQMSDITSRLEALEESTQRIEAMLEKLTNTPLEPRRDPNEDAISEGSTSSRSHTEDLESS